MGRMRKIRIKPEIELSEMVAAHWVGMGLFEYADLETEKKPEAEEQQEPEKKPEKTKPETATKKRPENAAKKSAKE